MDPRFLPAFEHQSRQLMGDSPFTRIVTMITGIEREVLHPRYHLRADGVVFLLINVAHMVVLPWEYAEIRNFFQMNHTLLEEDIRKILNEAKHRASNIEEQEISAKTLLEAVYELRDQLSILALQVWGPGSVSQQP
jgi:hypothetical protein